MGGLGHVADPMVVSSFPMFGIDRKPVCRREGPDRADIDTPDCLLSEHSFCPGNEGTPMGEDTARPSGGKGRDGDAPSESERPHRRLRLQSLRHSSRLSSPPSKLYLGKRVTSRNLDEAEQERGGDWLDKREEVIG